MKKKVSRLSLRAMALLLLISNCVALADELKVNALVGIWGAERLFVPSNSIQVTVTSDSQDRYFAHALGVSVNVSTTADKFQFELPRSLGSFSGQKVSETLIVGHWISEPGLINFSPYASPMNLTQTAKNTWTGKVQPLPQNFSMYLNFQQGNDTDKLNVFLKNPERNQGIFIRVASAKIDDDQVRFFDKDDHLLMTGKYRQNTGVLSVFIGGWGGTYDFTKRDRRNAVGFFPRAESDTKYQYRLPAANGDGWSVNYAEKAGLSSQKLTELVQFAIDSDTNNFWSPSIHSVLVARNSQLVLEEYFYGFHADRVHDLRSASKSITGLMVGKAIDESKTFDVNSRVYDLLRPTKKPDDIRKANLTVSHLLNMASGFECDDNNYESLGNEDRIAELETDWRNYTLDLPLAREPGEKSVYCTAGINLLGAIVNQQTGEWLPEFFRTRFAEPMQIDNYYMNLDPQKNGYAGGGLQLKPRDFLKFAQMMLDQGQWNGQQIIPAAWVASSFSQKASINKPNDYSMTWWVDKLAYKGELIDVFSASGNGGQLLIIMPKLDIAVAFNGGNYANFRTWGKWKTDLMTKYILTAVLD
jgi:CubicO group peptidase (beta-lactamase class C family)